MVKCPKCGREIDYLNHVQSGEMVWKFRVLRIDKEFVGDWERDQFYSDDSGYFECPECGETLFFSEEEAKKFLEEDQQTK